MSSYIEATRHPLTLEWEDAFWVDDYFAHHHYGVVFLDGTVADPWKTNLETKEERVSEITWDDYPLKDNASKEKDV